MYMDDTVFVKVFNVQLIWFISDNRESDVCLWDNLQMFGSV